MPEIDIPELSLQTILTATAAFVLVVAVWGMGVVLVVGRLMERKRQLRVRLETGMTDDEEARVLRLWHEGKEYLTAVATSPRVTLYSRLRRLHEEAGVETAPGTFLLGMLAFGLLGGAAIFLLSGRIFPSVSGAVGVFVVYYWTLTWRANRRLSIFERQLVDALELAARALRAGHPLLGSFRLIAEEVPAPVGTIFSEICQQQAMGVDLQDALRKVASTSRNMDMRLLSASMAINLSCGGNVAQVVEGLASVIRDRLRLNRRFRVMIAQTQLSKRILIAMPIVMFAVLNTLNPKYMSELYLTRVGNLLLLVASIMLLLGWWAMNRMADLKP